jgi:hypothetical protein
MTAIPTRTQSVIGIDSNYADETSKPADGTVQSSISVNGFSLFTSVDAVRDLLLEAGFTHIDARKEGIGCCIALCRKEG